MHKQLTDLKCQFECKNEDDSVGTFTGVASTTDVDADGDIIAAGAFDPIPMKRGPNGDVPNVLLLRDHDRTQIIGGWKSFMQHGNELQVEGELCLDIPKAAETHSLMKRGYLSGLSVCFSINDPKHIGKDKAGRRVIKKGVLRECSIVGFPSNAQARITGVKSEVDAWLIERGFASGDLEKLLQSLRKQNGFDDEPLRSRIGRYAIVPRSGEAREDFMTRCLRKTGGDMEACTTVWDEADDETEDEERELQFDQHLLPTAKWTHAQLKESDPQKPWGDVEYADPGYQDDKVKRYPIDVKWRIRAAWNRIHQANNRSQYTAEQLKRIEARIVAAWKDKIDPDGPPAYQEAQGKSSKPNGETTTVDPTAVFAKTREIMDQLRSKRVHS